MKQVYEARDMVEAHMLKDYLESYGIESIVKGDILIGAAGELPVNSNPSVWIVDQDFYEKAIDRVRNFENARQDDQIFDNVWHCASCDEIIEAQFTQCWKCGAERTP